MVYNPLTQKYNSRRKSVAGSPCYSARCIAVTQPTSGCRSSFWYCTMWSGSDPSLIFWARSSGLLRPHGGLVSVPRPSSDIFTMITASFLLFSFERICFAVLKRSLRDCVTPTSSVIMGSSWEKSASAASDVILWPMPTRKAIIS